MDLEPSTSHDEQSSGDQAAQPFFFVYTGSHGTVNSNPNEEWKEKPYRSQGSRNIARNTVARIQFSINLLTRHHGVVTAIATVVIAGLTCQYVTYSRRQWEAMDATLKQMEQQTNSSKISATAGLMGSIASTIQAGISKKSLEEGNTQNLRSIRATEKIAGDANDLARQSLEAQIRPWVGISGDPEARPVYKAPDQLFITFTLQLKNFGPSPAVRLVPRFVASEKHTKPFVDDLCNSADKQLREDPYTRELDSIFPGWGFR